MEPRRAERGVFAIAGTTAGVAAALLLIAFVLAACGSGSSAASAPATSSGSATTTTSPSAATTPPSVTPTLPGVTGAGTATGGQSVGPDGTVPSRAVTTAPAAPIGATGTFAAGLTVSIGQVGSITATASLPGEISGPAVTVPITVKNASGGAVAVPNLVVVLTDSSGAPAPDVQGSPAAPIQGSIAAGASANGVYVFSLSTDNRSNVSITVTYSAEAPVVLFTGNV